MHLLLVTALSLVVLAAFLILIQLHRLGTPPMPSNPRIRAAVLTLLSDLRDGSGRESPASPGQPGAFPASPRPPRRIYELGSGWGGLSRRIAREHPDIPVVGVERSLVPWLFSTLVLAVWGPSNLGFRFADLTTLSIGEPQRRGDSTCSEAADGPEVIIAYLSSRHMERLAAMLPAGHHITVISAAFALPGRRPDREIRVRDMYRTPVYRYDL